MASHSVRFQEVSKSINGLPQLILIWRSERGTWKVIVYVNDRTSANSKKDT